MFKKLSLATAIVVASATIASADSFLSDFASHQHDAGVVALGTVTSDGPGMVEIYNYHSGEQGALLGADMVHPGANMNVDINVPHGTSHAIAVLKVNGVVADTQEIVFD